MLQKQLYLGALWENKQIEPTQLGFLPRLKLFLYISFLQIQNFTVLHVKVIIFCFSEY